MRGRGPPLPRPRRRDVWPRVWRRGPRRPQEVGLQVALELRGGALGLAGVSLGGEDFGGGGAGGGGGGAPGTGGRRVHRGKGGGEDTQVPRGEGALDGVLRGERTLRALGDGRETGLAHLLAKSLQAGSQRGGLAVERRGALGQEGTERLQMTGHPRQGWVALGADGGDLPMPKETGGERAHGHGGGEPVPAVGLGEETGLHCAPPMRVQSRVWTKRVSGSPSASLPASLAELAMRNPSASAKAASALLIARPSSWSA